MLRRKETAVNIKKRIEEINAYDWSSPWDVRQRGWKFLVVDNESRTEFGGAEIVGTFENLEDAARDMRARVDEWRATRRSFARY
jgi:hypothetical protein